VSPNLFPIVLFISGTLPKVSLSILANNLANVFTEVVAFTPLIFPYATLSDSV